MISNLIQDLTEEGVGDFTKLIKKNNITLDTVIDHLSWSKNKHTRICLERNNDWELILICWMPNQKVEIHDHNGQKCTVHVLSGVIEECLYNRDALDRCISTTSYAAGETTQLKGTDLVHSLENTTDQLAVTLHLYAKPILSCDVFDTDTLNSERVNLTYDRVLDKENELSKDLEAFLAIAKSLVADEIHNPVTERIPIKDLKDKIDFGLEHSPLKDDDFYNKLQNVVLNTPKTSSKLFFNQLFGGRQSKSVLGDLLAVMLNNSMYTYKVAGVQVAIEKEILEQVRTRIGYGNSSGGTFPTGGSMSNYMSMVMARDKYDKNAKAFGKTQKLIAYTSIESHYSIEKNASLSGIGRENVRKIESDSHGKMIVKELRDQIELDLKNGLKPFFINATAATTVLGAYDPFEEIGAIAKEYDLWLHIDGAYGGAAIFSEKYRKMLKGVELSDSFSFNPHKMLGTPMTCSIIMVKDKNHLYKSFDNAAEYLYQTEEDDYNLGKTSFQCGRRNDALKLWTLWKSKGTEGIIKIVEKQFELAEIARDYILDHPDYKLFSFENSISVCFNYKNKSASELCTSLYENNKLMIGYGHFKGIEFVRLVTINATNTKEDIINLFKVIENHANEKEEASQSENNVELQMNS